MRQSARPCADRNPGEELGTSPPTSHLPAPLHGLPPTLPPETGLKRGDSDPSPETGGRSARESGTGRDSCSTRKRAGRLARGSRKQGLHTHQEEGPHVSKPRAGCGHVRPPSRALPEHPARVGRWHVVSGLDPCSMPGGLGQEGPMASTCPPPARGKANLASDRGERETGAGLEAPGQGIARCEGWAGPADLSRNLGRGRVEGHSRWSPSASGPVPQGPQKSGGPCPLPLAWASVACSRGTRRRAAPQEAICEFLVQ